MIAQDSGATAPMMVWTPPGFLRGIVDGVFERHKNFFDIWRHMATTLDAWPERDWRREDQAGVQPNGVEVVVQIRPLAAVKGIARLPHARPAVLPSTCSADVTPTLVGEKHVSAPIETLGVPLQTP